MVIFGPLTGTGQFTLFITNPSITNASIPTPAGPANDVLGMNVYEGNTAPLPPASAGGIVAYVLFGVKPASITLPAGQSFAVGTNYQIQLGDPLNIPVGTYVYCALYAGSTLIGSGSNAYITNGQDTGPGFVCNAANHGNSTSAGPNFLLPSLQAGITYTIVYSI